MQRVGNARTAGYNDLNPIFTALLLGEKLSPVQAIGAAIILSGVCLTRVGCRYFLKGRSTEAPVFD